MATSLSGYRPTATGISGMKGTGYQGFSLPTDNPQQQSLFQGLFSHLGPNSQLSKLAGGDQGQFEEMEAPAWRDFASAQGNMASRFSGMGGTGAQKSSGFRNTMGAMGSDFAQKLAGNRMNLQRQALGDLFSMSNMMMGHKTQDQYIMPKQKAWWQDLITTGVHGLAEGAASGLTGGGGVPWNTLFKGASGNGTTPQGAPPGQVQPSGAVAGSAKGGWW